MGAVGEAKIVISADDRTGSAFTSLARKVEGLGKATKSVGEAAGSIGKIAGEVDKVSGAVARSTEAVSRFSGVLKTVDGAAVSIGQVAASVERAAATMPRLTADAGTMAAAMKGVAEAERAVAVETDRIAKAGSKLSLFKALQGDFKQARATFNAARGDLDALARQVEQGQLRINALRQRRNIAAAAEARAKGVYAANPVPGRADAADKAKFDAMVASRAAAAKVMMAAEKERRDLDAALLAAEHGPDARKTARAYEEAQKTASLAGRALEAQKTALMGTRREFEALAGPLTTVSGAEKRLVVDAEAATRAFEAQGRAAVEAGEAAARALAREEAAFARAAAGRTKWAREFKELGGFAAGQRGAIAPRRGQTAVEALAAAMRRPAHEPPHSAAGREVEALADAKMRLAVFREMQESAAALRRAARDAQAEAARVGLDVRASKDPSPELLAAHAVAQGHASEATRAFEAQAGTLKGLKAQIEGVIGPMHSLASAEAQLAGRAERAEATLKRQEAIHTRLHALHGIADDVLPFEGPEILHLTREAYQEGAQIQHERVGLVNAGRTPEQVEEIEARSREVSARLPTATSEENLKIIAETTPAFGSLEHALEHLEFMQKTMSVLKSAGGEHIHGSAGDVGRDFAKFFEERLTKPEEFEHEAKQMIPAMVASGGTFNPREMYMFAQQAKSALPNYDMRFVSRIVPSLVTAMGGERAGTAANAFNSIIMGKVNDKKQAEAWLKAGLLDKDKVIMKAGHAVGWQAGAVKETDLALRDPLLWAETVQNPALAGQGVDLQDRLSVAKYLGTMYRNQNGNMFATEMTQAASIARLHKDEGLYNQVGNADDIYKRNLHEDPTVALGALGSAVASFAANVTSPAMKDVANVLGSASEGMAHLGKAVSDFDAAHPDLAKAIGGAALGTGLGVGGYLTTKLFTNLGGLLSGSTSSAALTGSATALTGSAAAIDAAAARLGATGGVSGGAGPGGSALKEAEKDASKLAPASPLLAGGAVPAIVGAVVVGGVAASVGMNAPKVDEFGREQGTWGDDPSHPYGFKEGNAMLRRRRAHNAPGMMSRFWSWATGGASGAGAEPKSILPAGLLPDAVPLPPMRPAEVPHLTASTAAPAVVPVPVATLPTHTLPPATATAPVPVHVVSTAANIPAAPLGPGTHRDFTLGNGSGGFGSPGLGAGGGFSPFPSHKAPSYEAVKAHAESIDVAPHVDLSGLDTVKPKADEAKAALAAVGAVAITPQVNMAMLDALIAKASMAKAALAGIAGAAGSGTTGSVGPSRVVAGPGVGQSR